MSPVKTATVLTHRYPEECTTAMKTLIAVAQKFNVVLRFDDEETRKHNLTPNETVVTNADINEDVDICITLGGDGTVLRALREYAGTDVPIFGVNFGEIGFLTTIEHVDLDYGFQRAFIGEFEVLKLPAVGLICGDKKFEAMNDVTVHRKPGMRVARLAYAIGPDEVGEVRCDGLVVCAPAGSTGYNLANGGPVMAWGVEGMAVSFIAAHSLSARVLVVAPHDELTVHNHSQDEPVAVAVDGRPVGEISASGQIQLRFLQNRGSLAQMPGVNFYHRLREKFGRLAT